MKKDYLIICLLTTLAASSVLMTGEAYGDGFDRRMGPEGWIEGVYSKGCAYPSCYSGERDLLFTGAAVEIAINESPPLKAVAESKINRRIWNEWKSNVDSARELQSERGASFFSCKRGALARTDSREWERITDEKLESISAGGLFGESVTDKNLEFSKVILWDEVDGTSDDGVKLAGDLRINRP